MQKSCGNCIDWMKSAVIVGLCHQHDEGWCPSDYPACEDWKRDTRDHKLCRRKDKAMVKELLDEYCGCVSDNEIDPCLGFLPGVANACCGHGESCRSYVQFLDGSMVRGADAMVIIRILQGDVETCKCDLFLEYRVKDFEISKHRERQDAALTAQIHTDGMEK